MNINKQSHAIVPGFVTTTYAYDHQGRLLTEKLKLNSENDITLVKQKAVP